MDELTRERYLLDMPPRLRPPRRNPRPVDLAVIEERRRVLEEGLKKRPPLPPEGRDGGSGSPERACNEDKVAHP